MGRTLTFTRLRVPAGGEFGGLGIGGGAVYGTVNAVIWTVS